VQCRAMCAMGQLPTFLWSLAWNACNQTARKGSERLKKKHEENQKNKGFPSDSQYTPQILIRLFRLFSLFSLFSFFHLCGNHTGGAHLTRWAVKFSCRSNTSRPLDMNNRRSESSRGTCRLGSLLLCARQIANMFPNSRREKRIRVFY